MFWRLLSDLGVWEDEGYLARKEARITPHKRCEMIPRCVIAVSAHIVSQWCSIDYTVIRINFVCKVFALDTLYFLSFISNT